jgi:membrane protein
VQALRARADRLRSVAAARFDDLTERSDLVRLGTEIWNRDRDVGGRLLGSAIAFRLFLFFVPLLLMLVGLAGFLADLVDADRATDTVGVSGAMSQQISAAFNQSNGARWTATLTGLFGALWAGRSLGNVLMGASAVAWGLPAQERSMTIRAMGALVGMLVGLGMVSVLANRIRNEAGVAISSLSFVAAVAIYGAAWVVAASTLPRRTSDPASSLPSGVLVGLTLAGLQAISQLFLPGQIERASELYGGLAATVATLGWFFFMGRSMALGFLVDAAVHDHFGGTAKALLSLPVLRAIPANVPRLARYLHLPEHDPEHDHDADPADDEPDDTDLPGDDPDARAHDRT